MDLRYFTSVVQCGFVAFDRYRSVRVRNNVYTRLYSITRSGVMK